MDLGILEVSDISVLSFSYISEGYDVFHTRSMMFRFYNFSGKPTQISFVFEFWVIPLHTPLHDEGDAVVAIEMKGPS